MSKFIRSVVVVAALASGSTAAFAEVVDDKPCGTDYSTSSTYGSQKGK